MLFLCGAGFAQDDSTVVGKEKKPSFFRKIGKGISMFIKEFDTVDTNYIEPQHYKFQAMLQSTSNLEDFEIKHKDGASVTFSPKTTTKIGPYAGYSLIFLGYTLQFNNLHIADNAKTFNLSLYTALFGVDFYYRKISDFLMTDVRAADGSTVDVSPLVDKPFDGFDVKRWGIMSTTFSITASTAIRQPTTSPLASGVPQAHHCRHWLFQVLPFAELEPNCGESFRICPGL